MILWTRGNKFWRVRKIFLTSFFMEFFSLIEVELKSPGFWQKRVNSDVKTALWVSRRSIWGNFPRKRVRNFIGFWSKNFWTFGKKSCAGLAKFILRVRRSILSFLKKLKIHHFFSDSEHKYSGPLPKNLGRVVKTAFCFSTGTIWGIFFQKNRFNSCRAFSGTFLEIWRKILSRFLISAIYVRRRIIIFPVHI